MTDVRITLLVTVSAIIGYAAIVLLGGCERGDTVYHVTCYSHGQAILDTESVGFPNRPYGAEFSTMRFTEAHTGKFFQVTGDCVIAKESP